MSGDVDGFRDFTADTLAVDFNGVYSHHRNSIRSGRTSLLMKLDAGGNEA